MELAEYRVFEVLIFPYYAEASYRLRLLNTIHAYSTTNYITWSPKIFIELAVETKKPRLTELAEAFLKSS